MKRFWTALLAILLGIIPYGAVAKQGEKLPVSIHAGEGQALLLKMGGKSLLIGGGDAQSILEELEAQLESELNYVVVVCDHTQHSAALEEIACQMNATVIGPGDELVLDGASAFWEAGVLNVADDGTAYRFGAQESQDGTISYRCDGSLIPFKAQTNESAVNVRADTSTKSAKVGKLKRGEALSVIAVVMSTSGEYWYQVQLPDGTTGYIRSDLIKTATEEALQQQEEAVQQAEKRYIGNKNSKVFHRPTCHTLPSGKNIVYLDSRDYAIAKGYKPCQNCNP